MKTDQIALRVDGYHLMVRSASGLTTRSAGKVVPTWSGPAFWPSPDSFTGTGVRLRASVWAHLKAKGAVWLFLYDLYHQRAIPLDDTQPTEGEDGTVEFTHPSYAFRPTTGTGVPIVPPENMVVLE